jgi:hypothetical protein
VHFRSEYVFAANALCLSEYVGSIGVEYDLQKPFAIAKINENDSAVVAPPMHPATDLNLLPDVRFVYLSAIVATHGVFRRDGPKK